MPNDETRLRALLGKLKEHGQVLLVVDQQAAFGVLPVAVAFRTRPSVFLAKEFDPTAWTIALWEFTQGSKLPTYPTLK